MRHHIGRFAVVVLSSLCVAAPAWAGAIPPGVPAPVIGLGLPALVGMGLLYRRLRAQGGNNHSE
jgi:hypothetical protein